ncbi:MAG TPA: cupin domain-containing protein [Candidatus Solibacter sp.]|nr:cupin domain-containing protein [Candidatus Solibacter sp.]
MKQQKTKWMVKHVSELPAERLEGVKITRVLEGTAFDNLGCEYVVLEKGQHLEPHVHEEANSFILILSGGGFVSMENQEIAIEEGYLVYVPAGVLHGFRTIDQPIVMYGFQSPPIIKSKDNVDIVFEKTGAQGRLITT